MKRFLSIAPCSVLLLVLMPLFTPPARSVTSADCAVNTSTAFVGDPIRWTVSNEIGEGPYTYVFYIHLNETHVYTSFPAESVPSLDYIPALPGEYLPYCQILDAGAHDWIYIDGPGTNVFLRAAPKGPKAAMVSGTSLKVSWNKVAGATGYLVERSTSKTSGFKQVKATTGTSFTNNGLAPGTKYFYRVRAYNLVSGSKRVSSPYSVVCAGVPLGSPNLTSAIAVGRRSVSLTWNKVNGATGYKIFKSAPGGPWVAVKSTTARAYVVTGLAPNTGYRFMIRAYKYISGSYYYSSNSNIRAARTWK